VPCYNGEQFTKLTVIRKAPEAGSDQYLCLCECGNYTIVRGSKLKSEHTKSCGCLKKEATSKAISIKTTHGQSKTKLYYIWHGMIRRCLSISHPRYSDYGGRGIGVCNEWREFVKFKEWADSAGYYEGLTLERDNVDGDYEPSNCRWITNFEQQSNRRNNHLLEYNDQIYTIAQLSRETGLTDGQIRRAIKPRQEIIPNKEIHKNDLHDKPDLWQGLEDYENRTEVYGCPYDDFCEGFGW